MTIRIVVSEHTLTACDERAEHLADVAFSGAPHGDLLVERVNALIDDRVVGHEITAIYTAQDLG